MQIVKDNRIVWLDTLRGFGIFLVFLGHSLSDNNLKIYIYSFHIPLFFFISGLFFKKIQLSQGIRHFLLKKVKTRLIPYVSFGLLTYFIWLAKMLLIKNGIYHGISPFPDNLTRPLLGMVYGNGINNWLIHNVNLWFLACLFVTELLAFFSMLIVKKEINFIILLVIFSVVGFLDSIFLKIRLPFSLDVAFTAIVFYGAAIILRDHLLFQKINLKYGIICLIIGIIGAILNGRVDMNSNVYGNYFLFYLTSFSNIFAYILIMRYIPSEKIISYLGKNSITFFLMQQVSFLVVNIMSKAIIQHQIGEPSNTYAILYTIISIIILIPFSLIISRNFPFMLGNLKARPK